MPALFVAARAPAHSPNPVPWAARDARGPGASGLHVAPTRDWTRACVHVGARTRRRGRAVRAAWACRTRAQILEENETLILGMVWSIILRYAVQEISEGDRTAKEGLLLWAQKKVEEASKGKVKVTNFHSSWQDGAAFCSLIQAFRPDLIDYSKVHRADTHAGAHRGAHPRAHRTPTPTRLPAPHPPHLRARRASDGCVGWAPRIRCGRRCVPARRPGSRPRRSTLRSTRRRWAGPHRSIVPFPQSHPIAIAIAVPVATAIAIAVPIAVSIAVPHPPPYRHPPSPTPHPPSPRHRRTWASRRCSTRRI